MKRTRGESSSSFACRTTRATIETLSCQASERKRGADSLTYTKRARRDGRQCLRGCSSSCRHLFNWEPTWSPWHPSRSTICPSTWNLFKIHERRTKAARGMQKFISIYFPHSARNSVNGKSRKISRGTIFLFFSFSEAYKYNMIRSFRNCSLRSLEKCTFMQYYELIALC